MIDAPEQLVAFPEMDVGAVDGVVTLTVNVTPLVLLHGEFCVLLTQ